MVSILNRIASGFRNDWRSLTAPQRRDAAGGLVFGGPRPTASWPNYELDGQVARAFRLAVVQACIDAIARDVSAAPLRVYREVDGQPQEQPSHAARIVVQDPNPAMSEAEFWHVVVSMAAATGFCVVEKVRSGAGRPVELWPLISPWLKVKAKPNALPDWEYVVPGNDPWRLPAEDVILINFRPDPWGGWTGRTPLTSLKRELAIDDQMTDFLNLLLERGGVPPIGLRVLPQGSPPVVPNVKQEDADLIVEKFAQKYGGAGNWGKPAFLGGLSVERIGLDLGEMLFPQVREHIELHICTAFGVPAGMIGTAAGLARNTYSNAETDVRKYYDGTIAPLWARLDGAFTRGLLREFDRGGTLSMGFDVSEIEALQEDQAPKWQRATAALPAGLITLNQAQSEIGLPGFGPAGDVLFLPFSVTPTRPDDLIVLAEEAAKPPEPVPAALLPGGGDGEGDEEEDPEEGKDVGASRSVRGFTPTILTDRNVNVPDDLWDRSGGALHFLPLQKRASLISANKQAIARLGRNGAPKLAAFWKEQGKRITEAATRDAGKWDELLTAIGTPQTHADRARRFLAKRDIAAVDWDEEEAALAVVLKAQHNLAGTTSFRQVAKELGIELDWNLANPDVRRVLNELATRIRGISQTTQEDVRRVVGAALDEGVTMQELSERLTGLFEETYRGRAMAVSRTESQVAYNRAHVLGYQESNVVAATELADNPEHTDDYGASDGLTCAERHGLVVPLDEAQLHIDAEHPNGSLCALPVLYKPLGEV